MHIICNVVVIIIFYTCHYVARARTRNYGLATKDGGGGGGETRLRVNNNWIRNGLQTPTEYYIERICI